MLSLLVTDVELNLLAWDNILYVFVGALINPPHNLFVIHLKYNIYIIFESYPDIMQNVLTFVTSFTINFKGCHCQNIVVYYTFKKPIVRAVLIKVVFFTSLSKSKKIN